METIKLQQLTIFCMFGKVKIKCIKFGLYLKYLIARVIAQI